MAAPGLALPMPIPGPPASTSAASTPSVQPMPAKSSETARFLSTSESPQLLSGCSPATALATASQSPPQDPVTTARSDATHLHQGPDGLSAPGQAQCVPDGAPSHDHGDDISLDDDRAPDGNRGCPTGPQQYTSEDHDEAAAACDAAVESSVRSGPSSEGVTAPSPAPLSINYQPVAGCHPGMVRSYLVCRAPPPPFPPPPPPLTFYRVQSPHGVMVAVISDLFSVINAPLSPPLSPLSHFNNIMVSWLQRPACGHPPPPPPPPTFPRFQQQRAGRWAGGHHT